MIESLTEAASTVLGGKPGRRRWRNDERCWIEVRGLADTETGDRLGPLVVQHVLAQRGVLSATLNYPLSASWSGWTSTRSRYRSCAMRWQPPRRKRASPPPAALRSTYPPTRQCCRAIGGHGHHCRRAGGGSDRPGAAVAAAPGGAQRCGHPRRLPAAAAPCRGEPIGHHRRRRGPRADFGRRLHPHPGAGVASVDLFVQLVKAAERQSAARTWTEREPVLAAHAECADGVRSAVRPRPRAAGPVERHGDRSGIAQVFGSAAVGLLTGDLAAAATAVVVAAPKAARNSREAFAATLGRGLADDHGVLTLRPAALRSLDRVDAVVVDPRALCGDDLQVGRIRGVAEADRAAVWQWAQTELTRGTLAPGMAPCGCAGAEQRPCGGR